MFRMYINLPNWSYMSTKFLAMIFKIFTITISIIWKYPLPTLVMSSQDLTSILVQNFQNSGYQNEDCEEIPLGNLFILLKNNV